MNLLEGGDILFGCFTVYVILDVVDDHVVNYEIVREEGTTTGTASIKGFQGLVANCKTNLQYYLPSEAI